MNESSWFPKRSETEMRRIAAETLYDLEMECRRQGWGADPALVYDEERDLFRFRDDRFVLTCVFTWAGVAVVCSFLSLASSRMSAR